MACHNNNMADKMCFQYCPGDRRPYPAITAPTAAVTKTRNPDSLLSNNPGFDNRAISERPQPASLKARSSETPPDATIKSAAPPLDELHQPFSASLTRCCAGGHQAKPAGGLTAAFAVPNDTAAIAAAANTPLTILETATIGLLWLPHVPCSKTSTLVD